MTPKTLALLPHQYELMKDTSTKVLGLVAGYGSGKSFVIARKAVQLALLNPGTQGIVCEPTYPMLDQILIPELKKALDELNVRYEYTNGLFHLSNKTTIIPKSMENWERLVGINASFVILDEFDTTKPDIAYQAYQKLLGRLRAGTTRQMVIVSTPEGFRAMHRIFIEEQDKGDKRLIRASTFDNYHLPKEYIQQMKDQYPSSLIDAYLNGEFINLNQGQVYYFKRDRRDQCRDLSDIRELAKTQKLPLHVGMDFNVGGCVSIVSVIVEDQVFVIDEIIADDTRDSINRLLEYKESNNNPVVFCYPDASSKARKTNASYSDIQLLKEHFNVRANSRNPMIKDRIHAVNRMLEPSGDQGSRITIHMELYLVQALERQAYNDRGEPEKFNDHPSIDDYIDAFGYFVAYKYPIRSKAKIGSFKQLRIA